MSKLFSSRWENKNSNLLRKIRSFPVLIYDLKFFLVRFHEISEIFWEGIYEIKIIHFFLIQHPSMVKINEPLMKRIKKLCVMFYVCLSFFLIKGKNFNSVKKIYGVQLFSAIRLKFMFINYYNKFSELWIRWI